MERRQLQQQHHLRQLLRLDDALGQQPAGANTIIAAAAHSTNYYRYNWCLPRDCGQREGNTYSHWG